MNIIILVLVAVVFVVSLIFSTRLQAAVFQALQIAGVIAQGAWARVTPTVRDIFMTAWRVARTTMIALLILWALNFLVFFGTGIAVNAPWSGLFLGVLIPMASIFWILRRFPVIGKVVRIPMVASIVVIIAAAPFFATGVWSPDVKGSLNRWSYDQKKELAYALDKDSLRSEAEFGVIGRTNAVTAIYDAEFNAIRDREGKEYLKLHQGVRVKAASMKGRDGMTQVILENPNGDFPRGNVVWIPSDKIDWDA